MRGRAENGGETATLPVVDADNGNDTKHPFIGFTDRAAKPAKYQKLYTDTLPGVKFHPPGDFSRRLWGRENSVGNDVEKLDALQKGAGRA